MQAIEYEVSRQGRRFTVLRRGPIGGTRLIAVYSSEWVANAVAYRLNLFVSDET